MKKLSLIIIALLLCVSLFAACGGKTNEGLEAASTYLHNLYKDAAEVTAADYEVAGKVVIDGVTYTVTWTVDTDKVTVEDLGNGFVKINVDEESLEEVTYKLTATIADAKGNTVTREYTHKVPMFDITSWDEYMAAAEGDVLVVQGTVVAINSKAAGNTRNHLFLMDATGKGGYYSYQMDADPVTDLGIAVGMTVRVTGPAAPYNGMMEIKGGTATIVNSEIKEITPVDITDKFVSGTDFNQFVALPVVVKGVTIGSQELETATSQYLFFELNGVKSYVRTYVTDFPTTLKAEDKATIDADHAAHFGYKADVTGILITYSGTPYIIPTSITPFTNYEEVIKTPAEKVAAEVEGLKLDASLSNDKVIDLLAKGKYYNDVTITWATDDTTGAATIADGKLTIVVPDGEVTVKVTATITCGDATQTKEFSIKLSKTITPIKDLIAIGAAQESYTTEKYIAGGIITEVQNDNYGNIVIKDENGDSILVYGTFIDGKKYGEAASKPVVGDYVVVVGVVGQYKGTAQFKNADITFFTSPSSAKAANDAGAAQESNIYTDTKYLVTGVVTEIANDKYGNLYIKDAEGNTLYIYGVYDQAGNQFNAMAKKPAVGDTITVLGGAGNYKGAPQLKNATLVALTPAASEGGDNTGDNTGATPADTLSIADAIALGNSKEKDQYSETKYYVTGVITEIYNTTYGNMYITDGTNTFCIYGTYDADGTNRFDAMANQPKVGDTVTVYGVIGKYNDPQMKNGWITKIVPEGQVDGTTVTVSLASYASANSWANGELYAELKLNSDITASVVATTPSSYGQNSGKYYESDTSWRMYQADTTSLTITAAAGKTIVSVKISYISNKNGVLLNGTEQIATDTVVTVNANSITFGVGNTSDVTNGQARVTAIEVLYK